MPVLERSKMDRLPSARGLNLAKFLGVPNTSGKHCCGLTRQILAEFA